MKTTTRDEIYRSLIEVDFGFRDIEAPDEMRYRRNIILFSPNFQPYLRLRIEKDSVNIDGGYKLHKLEKLKKWYFKDYSSVDNLVDDITVVTREYAESFELVRK